MQTTSTQSVQPEITPVPDLCPGDCRLEGGFASILSFPSSSLSEIISDNSTERTPFFTEVLVPIIFTFADGSNTTSTSTSTRAVPESLSDLLTTDEVFTTQRIWSQFGTLL